MLVWEDECWFSRFAQPGVKAWTAAGKPLVLQQRERKKDDQEAKAVACYGALEGEMGQVLLRFSPGQPNSCHTIDFLEYLLEVATRKGKGVLVLIWDNASWHKSQALGQWVRGHNRRVKQEGGVRLLLYLLPSKSPWLNPQEPHWAHGKKNVLEPGEALTEALTERQLKERIRNYFHSDAPLESFNLSHG